MLLTLISIRMGLFGSVGYRTPPRDLGEMSMEFTVDRHVVTLRRLPEVLVPGLSVPEPQPRRALGFAFTAEPWDISQVRGYGSAVYRLPPEPRPYLHAEAPHWYVIPLTAVMPAAWAGRLAGPHAGAGSWQHSCVSAVATTSAPTPGRCPECGRPAADAEASAVAPPG